MQNIILQKLIETFKKPALAYFMAAVFAGLAALSGLKTQEVKDLACAQEKVIEIKK